VSRRAKKTYNPICNHDFPSQFESDMFTFLHNNKGELGIEEIILQPQFELFPKFTDAMGMRHRRMIYTPDFTLIFNNGEELVVEAKGHATPEFKLRSKVFLNRYNVKYYIVYQSKAKNKGKSWEDILKDLCNMLTKES
jgi:hypothetical protein